MTVQVYAPAKVILAGEHAVVYGKPAIALPLDRGVHVTVTRTDKIGPILVTGGLGGTSSCTVLHQSLERLVELCGERVRQLQFHIEASIPSGSGLGSSAALAVALIRGVHRFFEEPVSDDKVSQLAMELETIFHGRPSGVDHTVIAMAKPIYFKSGRAEILSIAKPFQLIVGLTGTYAGTREMVEGLRSRLNKNSTHIFDEIETIVNHMRDALALGNLKHAGELMNANQIYLKELGVSTANLDKLCEVAREHGALGAKLTGAGGGGGVIALTDDKPERILQAFEQAGCQAFVCELGCEDALF